MVDATPDATPAGQVSYACALIDHALEAYGDPASWEFTIGADAPQGAIEVSAAASLVGGTAAFTLADYPELSEHGTELTKASNLLDIDLFVDESNAFADDCAEAGLPSGEPDASPEGRTAYACALAEYVLDEHGDPTTWEIAIGEDPALHETASVGALMGGMWGYEDDDPRTELSSQLVYGIATMDFEGLSENLDAFVAECG